MSRDVIGHVTNRFAICYFLLLSHFNWASIFNRFRDIRPPKPVRAHRDTRCASDSYSVPCNVLHWTDNYPGEPRRHSGPLDWTWNMLER